ncbi:MAG TPA: Ig-like domain-containing protein [Allosphingosinicella sp.]
MIAGGARFFLATSLLALTQSARANETVTYSYDSLGRLTRVSRSGTVNDGVTAHYCFDSADNRSNVTVGPGGCTPPPPAPVPPPAEPVPPPPVPVPPPADPVPPPPVPVPPPTVPVPPPPVPVPPPTDPVPPPPAPVPPPTQPVPPPPVPVPPPPPNQPPVTAPDSLTLGRCNAASVNVTSNDNDPENQALTLVALSEADPDRGVASIASASFISFQSSRMTGSETLTYTVADSLGATATGTLTVTVSGGACPIGPVEEAPVAPPPTDEPPAESPPADQAAAEAEKIR